MPVLDTPGMRIAPELTSADVVDAGIGASSG
jgi:hypothetical protein